MKKLLLTPVLIISSIFGFHTKHYKVCVSHNNTVVCSSTNFTKKEASIVGHIASEINDLNPDAIWIQDNGKIKKVVPKAAPSNTNKGEDKI